MYRIFGSFGKTVFQGIYRYRKSMITMTGIGLSLYALKSKSSFLYSLTSYSSSLDTSELMKKYPSLSILQMRSARLLIDKLRDKTTEIEEFRLVSKRIFSILVEEGISLNCNKAVTKTSPIDTFETWEMDSKSDIVAISILRSGNAMLETFMNIVPKANVGKVLVQRDEKKADKTPIYFYEKLPDTLSSKSTVFLLDPMIATGGSSCKVISILLEKGVREENITFISLISCEDGIANICGKYPKMKILTGVVDPKLLPNKFISPGLGDYGDRYYGTKMKD